MSTDGKAAHDHEGNPGMDVLVGVYFTLFFAFYCMYFYMVTLRWPTS